MPELTLVRPTLDHLHGYVDALQREWSPDNVRGAAAAEEELAAIGSDPGKFIDRLTDREAKGPPVVESLEVLRGPAHHDCAFILRAQISHDLGPAVFSGRRARNHGSEPDRTYSARSATIGRTRVALCAGTNTEKSEITATSTVTGRLSRRVAAKISIGVNFKYPLKH